MLTTPEANYSNQATIPGMHITVGDSLLEMDPRIKLMATGPSLDLSYGHMPRRSIIIDAVHSVTDHFSCGDVTLVKNLINEEPWLDKINDVKIPAHLTSHYRMLIEKLGYLDKATIGIQQELRKKIARINEEHEKVINSFIHEVRTVPTGSHFDASTGIYARDISNIWTHPERNAHGPVHYLRNSNVHVVLGPRIARTIRNTFVRKEPSDIFLIIGIVVRDSQGTKIKPESLYEESFLTLWNSLCRIGGIQTA